LEINKEIQMTEEELYKLVDHEIQWLRYYALAEYRNKLTDKSDIYNELISIGYAKRTTSLDLRCLPCTITSSKKIEAGIDLSELTIDSLPRRENFISPIEAYMIIFPNRRGAIIERLK
jgi:hypothetical protein